MQAQWQQDGPNFKSIDCQFQIDTRDGTIILMANQCQHAETSNEGSRQEYSSPADCAEEITRMLREGYSQSTA